MNCQSLYSGKNKKKYIKLSSAEFFTQHTKQEDYVFCKLIKSISFFVFSELLARGVGQQTYRAREYSNFFMK